MSKRKTSKQPKGTIPESIQYRSLVAMSRTPSVRDLKRRARKAAKLDLKKGVHD